MDASTGDPELAAVLEGQQTTEAGKLAEPPQPFLSEAEIEGRETAETTGIASSSCKEQDKDSKASDECFYPSPFRANEGSEAITERKGEIDSRLAIGGPRKPKSRPVASRYMQTSATPSGGSTRSSIDRLSRASSVGPAVKSQSRLSSVPTSRKPVEAEVRARPVPSLNPTSSFKVPAPKKPKVKAAPSETHPTEKPTVYKHTKSVSNSPVHSPKSKHKGRELSSFSAPSSPARHFPSARKPFGVDLQSVSRSAANSPSDKDQKISSPYRTLRQGTQTSQSPTQSRSSPASTPSPRARSTQPLPSPASTPSPKAHPKTGIASSIPRNVFTTPPAKGRSPTAVARTAPSSPIDRLASAPVDKALISSPPQNLPSITIRGAPNRSSRFSNARIAPGRELPDPSSVPQSPVRGSKSQIQGQNHADRAAFHAAKSAFAALDRSPKAAVLSRMSDIGTRKQAGPTAPQTKAPKEMTKHDWETLCMVLHNRDLQWQFANLKAREAAKAQEEHAEKQLWEALKATEQLRARVLEREFRAKQLEVIRRAELFLHSHEQQLEEWTALEPQHMAALTEALEAMLNTTLRVPLLRGAKADVESLKKALDEVNQLLGMLAKAITKLHPRAEKLAGLMTELASTAKDERETLYECGGLLADLSHVELHERSLRAHLIQVERDLTPRLANLGIV